MIAACLRLFRSGVYSGGGMLVTLALAFGLMLVLEGILPLVFPRQWRETWQRIAQFSDGQIRFLGLLLGGCGLLIVILVSFLTDF
ncbi:MAG: DUF2065 domain-containing protein [Pseudomonadota bacterium]